MVSQFKYKQANVTSQGPKTFRSFKVEVMWIDGKTSIVLSEKAKFFYKLLPYNFVYFQLLFSDRSWLTTVILHVDFNCPLFRISRFDFHNTSNRSPYLLYVRSNSTADVWSLSFIASRRILQFFISYNFRRTYPQLRLRHLWIWM